MKKYFFLIVSMLILFTACDSSTGDKVASGINLTPSEGTQDDQMQLENYLPMYENSMYEYVGEGDSSLNYYILNTFIRDNKVQRKFIAGYATTDYVLDYDNEKAVMIYSDLNDYFFKSYLDKEPNSEITVLQEPFTLGNKWEPEPGAVAEITGIDVDVSVPFGDFKALEVTTIYTSSGYTIKEYYANEIGLVKSTQEKEDEPTYTTMLNDFQRDYTEKIDIVLYYPDYDDYSQVEYPKSIELKTNDDGLKIFEDLLKTDLDGGGARIISENTKINDISLVATQDYKKYVILDLSKEYRDEMNVGSGFEMALIQSLTDTVCNYTGATQLKLLIDGEEYSSGHIEMQEDHYFNVSGYEETSSDDELSEEVISEEIPAA